MSDVIVVEERELSPVEVARRKELEDIIHDNFLGFVAVGKALAEIRDSRLYRGTHKSWEHYCRDLWDMSYQRAHQLESAALVVENISTIVETDEVERFPDLLPCNEAQARELARLEPDEQREVWEELISRKVAQQGKKGVPKITAMTVKKAVKAYKGEKLEVHINISSKEVRQNRKDFQSDDFTKAWEIFWEQVNVERRKGWRHTSREAVFNHLNILVRLVAEDGSSELKAPACSYQTSDREKLLAAGFKIFRMDAGSLIIEECRGGDDWYVSASFQNEKELEEAFEKLLVKPKNLRA